MSQASAASAFFLPGKNGPRFCLFHQASQESALRGAFIYLHPFAEEMNCSRRIAAHQSRRLARLGFAVLQIDLSGCGDSAGEFADASWEAWREDVADAAAWLRLNGIDGVGLWGLRLGALLALDMAARLPAAPGPLLLWQPVLDGRRFLTQFLRLALAGQALAGGVSRFKDTAAMRAALVAGQTLEIGGYELGAALAAGLDSLDAAQLPAPTARVHWLESGSEDAQLPAASQRQIDRWREGGVMTDVEVVDAAAFWSIPGHTAADALSLATERLLLAGRA